MNIKASSIEEYISKCPEERQEALKKLRNVIKSNIPDGFKEQLSYGMPGYVVPHELYPGGYHCDPKLPLPFCSFASQKNFIAFYHSGIYAKPELKDWFVDQYKEIVPTKIDMGKSCIRFKKPEQIPFDLIGELMQKMTVNDWIDCYESALKRK
tara:strand:- start:17672 stop:18130 length:459 start_codon:yes stop_codon:yes gene_type:complete